MDRERAEAFLRLLVEAELRRLAEQPGDLAVQAGCITRVIRAARVLTAVRSLGDEVAGQVLDDFELALVRRQAWPHVPHGRGLRWLMRSAPPRTPPAVPDHAVAVGQVIPVRDEQVSGEVIVLSYAQTASGALLIIVARPGQLSPVDPEGPWYTMPGRPGVRRRGPLMIPFLQFTAADDQGASYQMSYIGSGSWPLEWTLRLYPDPPRDLSWLDLSATPGGPAVRIDLTAAGQPPASSPVTASPVTRRPAEQLLNNVALRLLTTAAVFPQDIRMLVSEFAGAPAGPLPDTAEGLGDVITALQASGALTQLSPVPGQLAALCARLNVTGHGITAPPAPDLPGPWLSVLTQHEHATTQAAPGRDGCAVVVVALPELDETMLTILGLTSSADGTILHVHASGPARHLYYGPPERNLAPAIWIRDSRGHWHATRVREQHEGDITMHLQLVPPLSHRTAWIEVLLAGQSAEVRATLPLRWQ
jgi:hypothetical protein